MNRDIPEYNRCLTLFTSTTSQCCSTGVGHCNKFGLSFVGYRTKPGFQRMITALYAGHFPSARSLPRIGSRIALLSPGDVDAESIGASTTRIGRALLYQEGTGKRVPLHAR
jgi:hypothetical protein